jgi:hypothetical protein
MENKLKFFDETFKVLLTMTVCAWIIYVMFLLFADDNKGCVSGPPTFVLTGLALAAGILTAPPLIYGLVRLVFSTKEPKSAITWMAGWMIAGGIAIFVTGAILLALALSQYGCR